MSFFKKAKREKVLSKPLKREVLERFVLGAAYGLGQAIGLTIIFALVISYLGRLFSALGGMPYIGMLLADIIEVTERTMEGIR